MSKIRDLGLFAAYMASLTGLVIFLATTLAALS